MTPEKIQSGSVLIGEERRGRDLQHPPPTSSVDVVGGGEELVEALRARGIVLANAQSLVAKHPAEQIRQAIAYFDSLPDAGPGLLHRAVTDGRSPAPRKLTPLELEAEYGQQIAAWLRQNFPEFDRPTFGPHPAAVAAVIRLHHRDGKGSLTKSKHGREIRAAVKAWKADHES